MSNPKQIAEIKFGEHTLSAGWDRVKNGVIVMKSAIAKQQTPEQIEFEKQYWQRIKNLQQREDTFVKNASEAEQIITNRANTILEPHNKSFVVDDSNRQFITELINYFTCNQNFVGNTKKGLFLFGPCGIGKTLLLNVFSNFWNDGYKFQNGANHIATAADICSAISDTENKKIKHGAMHGFFVVNRGVMHHNWIIDELCGELSIEPTKINSQVRSGLSYVEQNNLTTIINLLHARHTIFMNHGKLTHITTNIDSAEKIEWLYGAKIRSRLREMFNMIEVTDTDRRK